MNNVTQAKIVSNFYSALAIVARRFDGADKGELQVEDSALLYSTKTYTVEIELDQTNFKKIFLTVEFPNDDEGSTQEIKINEHMNGTKIYRALKKAITNV